CSLASSCCGVYPLSLHDALPISAPRPGAEPPADGGRPHRRDPRAAATGRREQAPGPARREVGVMLGQVWLPDGDEPAEWIDLRRDRKSTRLNSSHVKRSYAVFCL